MHRYFTVTVSMRSPLGHQCREYGHHVEFLKRRRMRLVDISFGRDNSVKLLFAIPHVLNTHVYSKSFGHDNPSLIRIILVNQVVTIHQTDSRRLS